MKKSFGNMIQQLYNWRMGRNDAQLKGARLIYRQAHGLNDIFVYENKLYRWLSFDTAFIQTQLCKRSPSTPCMSFIKPLTMVAEVSQIERNSLLLGAGCGALYHYLTAIMPHIKHNLVEHHPLLIDIGEQYFHIPPDTVTLSDAKSFVFNTNLQFDYIFVDLYQNEITPLLQDEEFLLQLQKVAQRGISFNLLAKLNNTIAIIQMIKRVMGVNCLTVLIPNSTNLILHFQPSSIGPLITRLTNRKLIDSVRWDESVGFIGSYAA